MRAIFWVLVTFLLVSLYTLGFATEVESEKQSFKAEVLTNKLDTPWGMTFLPDETMLITERDGTLRKFNDGKLSSPLKGVPKVWANGQGGLLDVEIDPNFASNQFVYLSYSEAGNGGVGLAVSRSKLDGNRLKDTKVIFRQNKKSRRGLHFGSRLTFADDGTLFITGGDRGNGPRSQDPFDHAGKIVRINSDGTIPQDNPFADGKNALPEIWSLGHRNAQGASQHPQTGALWTVEHGARGGDEINQPQAGKNYGWPTISYGRKYSGGKIGIGTAKAGLEQPVYFWDPSIAPSGMTIYDGDLFKNWQSNIFVGALKFQMLVRLEFEGGKIVHEERLLEDKFGRVRDVTTGPDGAIYLLTNDGEGLLVRLSPT